MSKLRIALVIFFAGLAAAIVMALKSMCKKEVSVPIGETFWLGVGDTAHIEGEDLSLSFSKVSNDSRCPPGVKCIWEGEVQLTINARQGERESLLSFKVGPGGDKALFGDYTIAILAVAPPRPVEGPPEESEYRIEAQVTRHRD